MRVLTVIPARGGSKGLPGKNTRPMCGLPLLAHSILCARQCHSLEHIVVSTDDEGIAAIAREHGALVPFLRPEALARDDTPMMPVIVHALEACETLLGGSFDVVVLLDPTSPGRLPVDVETGLQRLRDDAALDGIVAVSQPRFNPFWVGVVDDGGRMKPAFNGAGQYVRRQDVPRFLRINGSFYAWRSAHVRSQRPWTDAALAPLEIPEERAFSIDSLADFEDLEVKVESKRLNLPWLP